MAEKDAKGKGKSKAPTALKRMKQNKKKRDAHKAFKSKVKTAIKAFKAAKEEKSEEKVRSSLNKVYSLLDKGVKIHVYKKNKVAREKSSFASSLRACLSQES